MDVGISHGLCSIFAHSWCTEICVKLNRKIDYNKEEKINEN